MQKKKKMYSVIVKKTALVRRGGKHIYTFIHTLATAILKLFCKQKAALHPVWDNSASQGNISHTYQSKKW